VLRWFAMGVQFTIPLTLAALCNTPHRCAAQDSVDRTVHASLMVGRSVPLPTGTRQVTGGYFGVDGSFVVLRGAADPPLYYASAVTRPIELDRRGAPGASSMNPAYVIWLSDSIGIYDHRARQLEFFDRSGGYLGQLSISGWPNGYQPLTRLMDSRWLAVRAHDESTNDSMRIVILSRPTGFQQPVVSAGQSPSALRIEGSYFTAVSLQPYRLSALATVERNRREIVIASSVDSAGAEGVPIRLTWVSVVGESAHHREIFIRAQPVSGETRARITDSVVDEATTEIRRAGLDTTLIRSTVARELFIPAFLPPLRWLQADSGGTAWLELTGANHRESICWFKRDSPDGRCAALPNGATALDVDERGRLLLVSLDKNGLPSLFTATISPAQ